MYKSKGTKFSRKYHYTLRELSEKLEVSPLTIIKWEKQGFDIYAKAKELRIMRLSPKFQQIWHGMCSRCGNPNNKNYKYYGGKGIKVLLTKAELAKLWINCKAYEMISPSIHRIDKNGHYEFFNCQIVELEEHHQISGEERKLKIVNKSS
jgi:hypothetical protein